MPTKTLKWFYVGIGLILALVPIVWTVAGSFRTEADLFGHPAGLIPHQWTLHGYRGVWSQLPFLRLLGNSVLFAGITTALTVLFDSMCAYALARLNFRGRDVAFWLVLVTLMVPFQVTLIPVFVELFHLGWLNTYQGLIVPRATSAFGIFLFRQFFMSIPRELDEAARIDGAGHLRIYWRVILPLAKPAIATVALLNFTNLWNDLLWPLVAISDDTRFTLQVGLANFQGMRRTEWSQLMAGNVLATVPLILAFLFAQKKFIATMTFTGIKG